jgi:hypothetical protein
MPRIVGAWVNQAGPSQALPRYLRLAYVSVGTHGAGSLFAGAWSLRGVAEGRAAPTPLEQGRTARLVRKARLKLAQRSRPRHLAPPRARRRSQRTAPLCYILTNLGQRDEPSRAPQTLGTPHQRTALAVRRLDTAANSQALPRRSIRSWPITFDFRTMSGLEAPTKRIVVAPFSSSEIRDWGSPTMPGWSRRYSRDRGAT